MKLQQHKDHRESVKCQAEHENILCEIIFLGLWEIVGFEIKER